MTFIESYKTSVPTHDMPGTLKTYLVAKKPTGEKTTSNEAKRYHVAGFSYCNKRTCLLHISRVVSFVYEPVPKLLQLEGAIIEHVERFPYIF